MHIVDIAPISTTDRHAVAAVIDSVTTKLTIVPYFVKTDADLIVGTKRVESTPGAQLVTVSDVDVDVTGSLGGREFIVVSSTLTTSGNLRVQSWQISTTGQLSRVEQYDETGSFSRLASTRTGLQDAAVGMRVGTSSQTVVSFHVTSVGVLRRVGTWDAEDLGGLALAGRSAEEDLVALFPDPSSSDLLLTHHVTNYQWSL